MLGLPLPVVNKASHDILKYAPLTKCKVMRYKSGSSVQPDRPDGVNHAI